MILAAAASLDPLLLAELGGVVLALALLARVSGWLSLSPIPLYLLAGLLFGPGGPVPLSLSETFIEVSSEIGVVLLLLMLGLEYTADDLVRTLREGAPAGAVDFALNFTPGLAAGLLLGWGPTAALLLGGITYISSSGVIAKLLSDLGRLGNRETPTVLGILVTEDLVMAAYLPLIAVLLAPTAPARAMITVTLAIGAAALVLYAAVRHGHVVSRLASADSDEAFILTVLGATLLVAGLAQRMQVSSAVGAFLVGIALSGPVSERAAVLMRPLRDVFAATFFLFFGLQIDVSGLPAVAPVALVLAALTAGTKVVTGRWAARRAGVGARGQNRAGTALIARGEFSIVIAGLGVAAGVEPLLGATAAAYVLTLAVAGPLIARFTTRTPTPLTV